MKTLLFLSSALALLLLGGCAKEPEPASVAPPAGVNQGTAAQQGQARPAGATSNQ